MFTTIRKHQRWLMLVIAALTIIAFAFLYNGRDRWQARETIDAMGPTMASFSRD